MHLRHALACALPVVLVGVFLGVTEPAAAAATLVVDGDGQAVPGDCNAPDATFTTIQSAVSAAAPGDTIQVCPGTYDEAVTIDKALTIVGANAGTPGTGARSAESIVQTSATDVSVFDITTASPVTIDGFTAKFTGSRATGGLLLSLQAGNQLTFVNNIVRDSQYADALMFDDSATSATVKDNLFTAIAQAGSPGSCVLCTWGQGAATVALDVTGNQFSNITDEDGVPAMNINAATGTVSGNSFSNIHQYGIILANQLGPLSITNNTFDHILNDTPGTSQNRGAGIRTFGTPDFVAPVTISGNHFTDSYNGVRVANDGSPATLNSNFTVKQNAFVGNTHEGISVAAGTLGGPLDGTCNWWGARLGPSGAGPGPGDAVSADVTFNPWLVTSNIASACKPLVNAGADTEVVEGDAGLTTIAIPVTITPAPGQDVLVTWTTANGSAKANSDFEPTIGTLTFHAADTTKSINVRVKGDTKPEKFESFTLNLALSSTAASIADDSTKITILNDEKPKLKVSASKVQEGNVENIRYSTTLAYYRDITLNISAGAPGDTAHAPGDYVDPTGQVLTIPKGTKGPVVLNVATNIDHIPEGNETFTIAASSADVQGGGSTNVITIKTNST